jgi:hypothetical protein
LQLRADAMLLESLANHLEIRFLNFEADAATVGAHRGLSGCAGTQEWV